MKKYKVIVEFNEATGKDPETIYLQDMDCLLYTSPSPRDPE